MRFIYLFSFILYAVSRVIIPEVSDNDFDMTLANNSNTTFVVMLYVESCTELTHGYRNILSTWEALFEEINGDLYKFININL